MQRTCALVWLVCAAACQPAMVRTVAEPVYVIAAEEPAAASSNQDSTATMADGAVGDLEVAVVRQDESAEAAVAASSTPAWDLEVEPYVSHERVAYYVRRYTTEARDRVALWLQRGRRYEPFIRSTFRSYGIPEDMYYLGLVESGYDPHAYSRAAAVGMWQFMTSTAKGMGLSVDWWVDERRDPVRSTEAAARFLAALRDQFGSLYLAAAAYNGGPGRISRTLDAHADRLSGTGGEDLFFALAETNSLRSETANYVPQLIAAALIGKEPERYGIRLEPAEPFAYDSVLVPAATAVAAVARAAGVELDALRDLNPHLLRGITPPGQDSWVRVPVGSADGAAEALAALPDSLRAGYRTRKLTRATTLATVARETGLTMKQLGWYNPGVKTRLAAGTVLRIPTRQALLAALDVPDPAIERYGPAQRGLHVVRSGETLSHIARRYGTTVNALMRLNGLRNSRIYAGQTIRVR
jgi:membrane-bound lytic murein transglycosylase D